MLKYLILSVLLCICNASELTPNTVHEATFYTGRDYTGESVTIVSKLSNTTDWQFLQPRIQSFCTTGAWTFYAGFDFKEAFAISLPWMEYYNPVVCYDDISLDFPPLGSLRHLGPRDTATPGITLYGMQEYDPDTSDPLASEELFVSGVAANNFGFTTLMVWVTGFTNWTLYETESFTGNATCVILSDDFGDFEYWGWSVNPFYDDFSPWYIAHPVRSVVKGCQLPEARIISPRMFPENAGPYHSFRHFFGGKLSRKTSQ